ncbi:choline transporter-like protein 1 [Arctopsyche grandis]|uniref:choline transporter-like protein 1 n=1 Tax=Arctopsyche grandis TaxID=121162 RepID=UPI00406DA363
MGQCCSNSNAVEPAMDNIEGDYKNESISNQISSSKSRSCTDIIALLMMLAFIIGLVVLIGYCMCYGDVYRIINGYDDCANVCGRTNQEDIDPTGSCKREDMSMKRLLVINSDAGSGKSPNNIHRECVESCDETHFKELINRCIPNKSSKVVNSFFSKTGLSDFFQEVNEDLHLCWREMLYLCIIAFVFSVIILVLFRFVVGFVVWFVLIGVSLTTVIATIFLWVTWTKERKKLNEISVENQDYISQRKVYSYLGYAILATVITFIILLVLLVMRKRIRLVIQLFKEAGKAIASMPLLLLEPILTFLTLCIVVSLWIYLSIWVESSGFLILNNNQSFNYRKDVTMKITRWYNLFALFWFTQFIIGCQHMVIAGAVATWFFTRNKKNLSTPIITSFKNLVSFHLGTVALGSLLIAFVQMLRAILQYIQSHLRGSENRIIIGIVKCCQCCLCCFEKFLKYMSRNAYIETAIYGYGFCKSGQQAFKVLASNALRVFAINSVGDFILFLGKAFVVIATVLIGIELIQKKQGVQHVWVPLAIVGIIAYLTSHCFMTVYEMAIDTIFICFCEDCERNDGITKPYYMSRGLMEFVQNSKKALAVLDESNSQAWTSPKTISESVDK